MKICLKFHFINNKNDYFLEEGGEEMEGEGVGGVIEGSTEDTT
jgi:hypothetical protein